MKIKIYPYLLILILALPVSSFADEQPMCNFGGWMSLIDKDGNCLPPWKSIVREDDGIADFGQTYTRKYSCGGKDLFRCNPLVFGPGDDGKGPCVSTNDKDANQATKACLETSTPESQQKHIVKLSKDPKSHAMYIGIAAETVRYCKESSAKAEYCAELENILTSSTKRLAGCTNSADLYEHLPYVVTPLNESEINKIANNLVPGFEKYMANKEQRRLDAIEHNEKVYSDAVSTYSESAKTLKMISTIKANATKCLESSCKTKSGGLKRSVYYDKKAKKYKKAAGRSMAYCFRYVKYGMVGSYTDNKWDVTGTYAVHAGASLKRKGFTNIMDDPAFKGLTPKNAPVGAIIVYKKKGAAKGRPGHIEVKTAESEYVSDFIGSSPTTVGGQRIPIGIYIKIPEDLKSKLVEVPNE
jgi:hypothetical protein